MAGIFCAVGIFLHHSNSFFHNQLLERHFGAALTEAGRQQLEVARQHAAAVTATLNAVNAYAEWAPLPDLAKYGIVHGYALHTCRVYNTSLAIVYLFLFFK